MLKQSLYYLRQCLKCKKKLNDILENLPTNEDEVYGIELARMETIVSTHETLRNANTNICVSFHFVL